MFIGCVFVFVLVEGGFVLSFLFFIMLFVLYGLIWVWYWIMMVVVVVVIVLCVFLFFGGIDYLLIFVIVVLFGVVNMVLIWLIFCLVEVEWFGLELVMSEGCEVVVCDVYDFIGYFFMVVGFKV